MMTEKGKAGVRRRPRIEAKILVKITGHSMEFETYTGNISKTGLFLETPYAIAEVGEQLQLHLAIPGTDELLRVRGKVARVSHPNQVGYAQGFAIAFTRIDTHQAKAFDKFLMTLFEHRGMGCRKAPRVKTEVLVEIRSRAFAQKVMTENISRTGLFLRTLSDGLEVGEQLKLLLLHPSTKRKFSVEAEVVHVRQGEMIGQRNFLEGIGVRFVAPTPTRQKDLTSFLKSILTYYKRSGA